ncbi:biotin-dependent carboxyltransferase family protein [Luteococcus sp. H138]|uniref:5-oxoprolinase subunit C family protein n=1 Tax=unclassified Luteococcus TaxID=2639923 RepID=UPI00313A9C75
MAGLVVERAGLRTLVQDLGRPGLASLGISASGAWDRAAFALANRIIGNAPGLACLEVVLGQLAVRAVDGDLLVALTGAPCPLTVDGRPVDAFSPVLLRAGQLLEVGQPVVGLRSYLAAHGGLDLPPVFNSRSCDPTRGIGPAVLQAGDLVPVGARGGRTIVASDLCVTSTAQRDELTLRAVWGPRQDWFTAAAHQLFTGTAWQVTSESDRVGTRLSGPALERAVDGELTSEAVVRGSVQVPSSGQPLVFGPDHPTTGGYPVIVVVDGPDADLLAQARPGQTVRFAVSRPRILA